MTEEVVIIDDEPANIIWLSDFLEVLEARRAADASGERAAAAMGQAQRARVLLWLALGGDAQASTRSISQ